MRKVAHMKHSFFAPIAGAAVVIALLFVIVPVPSMWVATFTYDSLAVVFTTVGEWGTIVIEWVRTPWM